jgi:hypothetical protein
MLYFAPTYDILDRLVGESNRTCPQRDLTDCKQHCVVAGRHAVSHVCAVVVGEAPESLGNRDYSPTAELESQRLGSGRTHLETVAGPESRGAGAA